MVNGDRSVDIKWSHSQNEKNVSLYCIKTSAPVYGLPEEHDITDLNETTSAWTEVLALVAITMSSCAIYRKDMMVITLHMKRPGD